MTFVLIGKASSREAYEQVSAAAGVPSDPPPGLLVHTASETEDGVQVVDIWESRQAAEDFRSTRLLPAMESSGVTPEQAQRAEPQMLEPFSEWIRG